MEGTGPRRRYSKKSSCKKIFDIFEKAMKTEKFDIDLYFKIIEKMTVYDGEKIIISLLDGTELEVVNG